LADQSLADIIAAAFLAGVKAEAEKQAKTTGKKIVKKSVETVSALPGVIVEKRKRKASAYSIKYGKAFKKVAPRYKTKSGSWKKNGFKHAQKAAHALAKKK